MNSRRGSDGGLEGGDGGVDEGVLVGGKVEWGSATRGRQIALRAASARTLADTLVWACQEGLQLQLLVAPPWP
jgi:hypothetical protein